MESFNFNRFQVSMFKQADGSYQVTVFDVKAGATWLEWEGSNVEEARKAVLSFLETSAKDFLTFKISHDTVI